MARFQQGSLNIPVDGVATPTNSSPDDSVATKGYVDSQSTPAGILVGSSQNFTITGRPTDVIIDGSIEFFLSGGFTSAQDFTNAVGGNRSLVVTNHPVDLLFTQGNTMVSFTLPVRTQIYPTGTTASNLTIEFDQDATETSFNTAVASIDFNSNVTVAVEERANELVGGTDISITEMDGVATIAYTGTSELLNSIQDFPQWPSTFATSLHSQHRGHLQTTINVLLMLTAVAYAYASNAVA